MAKRVFLIVLDSFGIGAAPDAKDFGDGGADTLGRISGSKELYIPNLIKLGLGNIDGVSSVARTDKPLASYMRLSPISAGKDTTVGHFELMGLILKNPLPTYPNGFPDEVIDEFSRTVGRGVLCNAPYSGTDVIRDYGEEHLKTGSLIVYTSADSVFQIAAHESVVPPEELYEICLAARKMLKGEHAVGRVIARPFAGEVGSFSRTANRRDFSLEPPGVTVLDKLTECGVKVIAVGKIEDIFAGRGISESIKTHSNLEGMQVTDELLCRDFSGLCFVNLVEFDSHFGHRQDIDGYARALSQFDAWLGAFLPKLTEDDTLIITADHGCDPGDDSTDHTRENIPVLIYKKGCASENLGTREGFFHVGDEVLRLLLSK